MWLCGGGNLPPQVRVDTGIAHAQFLSQAGLLAWLVIATFIDIDEQTIPDAVTIPGALLGLLLAAVLPFSLLPTWPNGVIEPLLAASPAPFPLRYLQPQGLALACLMYLGWWFVIWPKTITFRHGYVKAGRYMLASMLRHPAIRWFLFLVLVGLAGIAATWWRGGLAWQALFSSLVGMIWGGAMVWGVRIVGTIALRREAMGFGDVTFLAMIGTYLGWQSTTFVFFIAPFTGVILALAQWLFTGKPAIPYGPFLAAASAVVLFAWPVLWSDYELVFHLGWGIPLIGFVCLLLMGGMLSVWRRFAY